MFDHRDRLTIFKTSDEKAVHIRWVLLKDKTKCFIDGNYFEVDYPVKMVSMFDDYVTKGIVKKRLFTDNKYVEMMETFKVKGLKGGKFYYEEYKPFIKHVNKAEIVSSVTKGHFVLLDDLQIKIVRDFIKHNIEAYNMTDGKLKVMVDELWKHNYLPYPKKIEHFNISNKQVRYNNHLFFEDDEFITVRKGGDAFCTVRKGYFGKISSEYDDLLSKFPNITYVHVDHQDKVISWE